MLAAASDGIVSRGKAETGDKTMSTRGPRRSLPRLRAGGGRFGARHPARGGGRRRGRRGGHRAAHRPQGTRELPRRAVDRPPRPGAPSRRRCCSAPRPTCSGGRDEADRVGIVFVSHSRRWPTVRRPRRADGASVRLVAAGERTTTGSARASQGDHGIDEADQGAGVVVISDLGSALMTAETAFDQLPDGRHSRVAVVDAPFVEAGVAAAVAAESGGDFAAVVAAAESGRAAWEGAASAAPAAPGAASSPAPAAGQPLHRETPGGSAGDPAGLCAKWHCATGTACMRDRPRST